MTTTQVDEGMPDADSELKAHFAKGKECFEQGGDLLACLEECQPQDEQHVLFRLAGYVQASADDARA